MNNIFSTFSAYLNYPFIKYALITGILIALCASLLGVILVLKRYSFMGDGLSHVAFGALALSTVLRINNEMLVVLPVIIICAILMLCTKRFTKIAGDSILAMASVGALAIGYLILNIFPSSSNVGGDVCGTLFGSASILTLSAADVWLCGILSVVILAIFFIFYDKIFSVTFDESFAAASGIRVSVYNAMISVLCAIIIVLAMTLAGSLLTSALIVFPALSAMRIFKSFRGVIICSGLLSVVCTVIGMLISVVFSTPVGCTIVVSYLFAFIVFALFGKLIK